MSVKEIHKSLTPLIVSSNFYFLRVDSGLAPKITFISHEQFAVLIVTTNYAEEKLVDTPLYKTVSLTLLKIASLLYKNSNKRRK